MNVKSTEFPSGSAQTRSILTATAVEDVQSEVAETEALVMPAGVGSRAHLGPSVGGEVESLASTKINRVFFFAIGLLLTATALAKLWMLLTDSFADLRVGIPKEILWLSLALELWLAYENFRIHDRRVLAFINVVVFSGFAIFAGTRMLLGYRSCGCSGSLELPSWLFLLIDLGIVGWLLVFFGRRDLLAGASVLGSWWRGWSPAVRGRVAGIGLFLLLIIGIQLPIAAPLRASIMGEPPVTAVVKIDGDLVLGEETTGHVELINQSNQPAKIIGMNRSCRCFELANDPIEMVLSAQQRVALPLVIKPKTSGPLHQRVELFLDHPNQFRVNVDVLGSVQLTE